MVVGNNDFESACRILVQIKIPLARPPHLMNVLDFVPAQHVLEHYECLNGYVLVKEQAHYPTRRRADRST